jgi:DNA invertase Pin-like site-specific DNA recombinase
MATYGYARVSAKDQDVSGQMDALTKAGCAKVFSEKVSGFSVDNRKELARALKALCPRDTLIVTSSIDTRSTQHARCRCESRRHLQVAS